MARRIVIWVPTGEGESATAAIKAAVDDCEVVTAETFGGIVAHALTEAVDAVLLLAGPIRSHEERLATIRTLRREGYVGPVLVGAAFLTEKQEALSTGADYAFDPDKQSVGAVVATALLTPALCADHPFLRALLAGELVSVEPLGDAVPDHPVDVLLTATSQHADPAFWHGLAAYRARYQDCAVIVVEDELDEEVLAEALAAGATHWVELSQSGVASLVELTRSHLRDRWLRRLAAV